MPINPTIQQLFDLSGKVFLGGGGARTLGSDMSEALAEAGADGVLTSRDAASGQATAASTISPGGFERGQPQAFIDAYSDKCILRKMGRDSVDLCHRSQFSRGQ